MINSDQMTIEDKKLIERAIKTLYGNIIEKPEDTSTPFVFKDYKGIAPSPRTYKGVWNWDSAFHFITMCYFDKEIAQDQMRILFDYQKEDGQIADVVYTSGKSVFKFTKPPVLAWAVMIGDKITQDTAFLEYCYPHLLKNLQWWENNRFDGKLFSYKVSKMESGWDNTVRFDFPHKIDFCYAVDCNSFMVTFYEALEYIAKRIGEKNYVKEISKKKEDLISNMHKYLYDSKNGYFCDYNKRLGMFTKRLSPASFMPLFVKVATKEQALAMKKLAEDPKYFYKGFPTISFNNRGYNSKKYWRGPTWLNTAYFAIRGLYDYGYKTLALEHTQTILNWCSMNEDSIYEYYDSKSGKGIGAKDFGWSSSFIIELILLKYGVNLW